MIDFPLDDSCFDTGSEMRVSMNPALITEYGGLMRDGVAFPPVLLYWDGARHYVADGGHRSLAAKSIGRMTIPAEVRQGTHAEAVVAGIAANRTHGLRFTKRDVKHQIAMVLALFPARSGVELSQLIGCSQGYVSRVRLRLMPEAKETAMDKANRRDDVVALVKAGVPAGEIRKTLHVHTSVIAKVRREMGITKIDKGREAVAARIATIRKMATQGYTVKEIAAAVEVGVPRVWQLVKREGDIVIRDRRDRASPSVRRPPTLSARLTPELQRTIEDQLRAGTSVRAIHRTLHVSRKTICFLQAQIGLAPPVRAKEPRPAIGTTERDQQVAELLRKGVSVREIALAHHIGGQTIALIRDALHIHRAVAPRNQLLLAQRLERIRTMAGEGYTTRQIAAAVGLGRDRLREITKKHAIDIRADRIVGQSRNHDANRIVDRIATTAENLMIGSELIHYATLDQARLSDWILSLKQAREQLGAFIRRLMQEQQHDETAHSVSA